MLSRMDYYIELEMESIADHIETVNKLCDEDIRWSTDKRYEIHTLEGAIDVPDKSRKLNILYKEMEKKHKEGNRTFQRETGAIDAGLRWLKKKGLDIDGPLTSENMRLSYLFLHGHFRRKFAEWQAATEMREKYAGIECMREHMPELDGIIKTAIEDASVTLDDLRIVGFEPRPMNQKDYDKFIELCKPTEEEKLVTAAQSAAREAKGLKMLGLLMVKHYSVEALKIRMSDEWVLADQNGTLQESGLPDKINKMYDDLLNTTKKLNEKLAVMHDRMEEMGQKALDLSAQRQGVEDYFADSWVQVVWEDLLACRILDEEKLNTYLERARAGGGSLREISPEENEKWMNSLKQMLQEDGEGMQEMLNLIVECGIQVPENFCREYRLSEMPEGHNWIMPLYGRFNAVVPPKTRMLIRNLIVSYEKKVRIMKEHCARHWNLPSFEEHMRIQASYLGPFDSVPSQDEWIKKCLQSWFRESDYIISQPFEESEIDDRIRQSLLELRKMGVNPNVPDNEAALIVRNEIDVGEMMYSAVKAKAYIRRVERAYYKKGEAPIEGVRSSEANEVDNKKLGDLMMSMDQAALRLEESGVPLSSSAKGAIIEVCRTLKIKGGATDWRPQTGWINAAFNEMVDRNIPSVGGRF